jgi:hypothetical protein
LRELLVGLVSGAALGFTGYEFSLSVLAAYLPGQAPALLKGYALMGGIAGCICAAALVAVIVKPKRQFTHGDEAPIDRAALLRALALNPDEECRALETASRQVILEMQALQIYDLFVEASRQGESER